MPDPKDNKEPEFETFQDYLDADHNIVSDFENVRTQHFNAPDLDRYLTYGSDTFGKLGYNPNVNMEELYLQNTDWTDDLSRAWEGHKELFKTGFTDTFAFGISKDEHNAEAFEKVMSDYAPTQGRDEMTTFWSNALLSAGYTTGIIGAIAAEEAVLAGVTALTGGLGGGVAAGESASLFSRGLYNLSKGVKNVDKAMESRKVFNTLHKMRNISNSRFANTSGELLHGLYKNVAPLGNTMDFLRSADKLKDMNTIQKAMTASGAIARDARVGYLTYSESKLEKDFVVNEVKDIMIDQWYENNPGQKMNSDVYEDIVARSFRAGDKAFDSNLVAIYLTNAMTFNGLFKGFSRTNGFFGRNIRGFSVKDGTVSAVKNSITENFKKKLSEVTWGSVLKKGIEFSGEGIQEVTQDIVSSAAKKYAGLKTIMTEDGPEYILPDDLGRSPGNYAKGSYFNNLVESLGDSSWETFLTGAAVGLFAGPANMATRVTSDFTVGEQKWRFSEKGRKRELQAYEERKEKAKFLTEFFEQSGAGTFNNEFGKQVYEQVDAMDEMVAAAKRGDKKYFEDKRGEVFRIGVSEVLKNGLQDEYISYLKDLRNYTPEEMNQAFGRTDITEENKHEFITEADQYIDRIKTMTQKYKSLENDPRFTTLDDFTQYDPNSREGKRQAYRRLAISELKREFLFSEDKIIETANRLKSISDKITKDGSISTQDLLTLMDGTQIDSEIQALTFAVKSDVEYDSTNTPEHRSKKRRLEALKKQKEFLNEAEKLSKKKNLTEDEVLELKSKMSGNFFEFLDALSDPSNVEVSGSYQQPVTKSNSDEKFDLFWDYISLNNDSGYYHSYAEQLNDPNSLADKVEKITDIFEEIDQNKEAHITEAIKIAQEKKTAEEIIQQLLDMGMVFNASEIDDLIHKGVMPSKIYDIRTNEEVTSERYQQALDLVNIHYKDLTGKDIKGVSQSANVTRERDARDKRTSQELLEEFSPNAEFDKPFPITNLINRLLKSKYPVNKELLRMLIEKSLNSGEVMLTVSGTKPISINKDGVLVLDVRFSSEDYVRDSYSQNAKKEILKENVARYVRNNPSSSQQEIDLYRELLEKSLNRDKTPTVSFEYLALTGILTNLYSDKLSENSEFKERVLSFMDSYKDAVLENIDESAKEAFLNSPFLYDPILFLTEALNNTDLQSQLSSIEYSSDGETVSLWDRLKNQLIDSDAGILSLENSLLEQIFSIAQEGLTQSEVDVVTETEVIEEEESSKTLSRNEIQEKLSELRAEISTLEKAEVELTGKEKENIGREIDAKYQLLDVYEKQLGIVTGTITAERSNPEETENLETGSLEDVDEATPKRGQIGNIEFSKMPKELQFIIAKKYFKRNARRFKMVGEITLSKLLEVFSEEDLEKINEGIKDHVYADEIGLYNNPVDESVDESELDYQRSSEEETEEDVDVEELAEEIEESTPQDEESQVSDTEVQKEELLNELVELQEEFSNNPTEDLENQIATLEQTISELEEDGSVTEGINRELSTEQEVLDEIQELREDIERINELGDQTDEYTFAIDNWQGVEPRSAEKETNEQVGIGEGKGIHPSLTSTDEDVNITAQALAESLEEDANELGIFPNTNWPNIVNTILVSGTLAQAKENLGSGSISRKENRIKELETKLFNLKNENRLLELDSLLESFKWDHRVAPQDLFSSSYVEQENKIIQLVDELGKEGKKMYRDAFNQELSKQKTEAQEKVFKTFDFIKKRNAKRYREKRKAEQKQKTVEAPKSFDEVLEERQKSLSPRENNADVIYQELISEGATDTKLMVKEVLNKLDNEVSVSDLIALYDVINNSSIEFTNAQVKLVNNRIQTIFQNNLISEENSFVGKHFKIKDGIVKIKGLARGNEFRIVSSLRGTSKNFSYTLEQFMDNIEEPLAEGSEYVDEQVSVDISKEEAVDIKIPYQEIFNNFTQEVGVSENENLSDQELIDKIREELKCK